MKQSLCFSPLRRFLLFPIVTFGLCLIADSAKSEIVDVQRNALEEGIVHYTFEVDLGLEDYDTIKLHRVVKERRSGRPSSTTDAIFMLPGAPNFFKGIFMAPLISEALPWDHSIAVFLAKNGIDVWGMDYAWSFVPLQTTHFDFMNGWGLEREIEFAEKALSTVRSIRVSTGQGKPRLHVLGFSYGVPIAYSMAGNETMKPPGKRLIKSIISVDYDFKVNDEEERLAACESVEIGQSYIDNGIYENDTGAFMMYVAYLAKENPGGISIFFPLLNNWEFALFLGVLHDPWHFVGGEFSTFPIPTGLQFSDPDAWVDLLSFVPAYMPRQAFVDLNTVICDEVDVAFDDHLGDITVPILSVGAAGGAAPQSYTPMLTASKDVKQITIQLLSDSEQYLDFGHGDLFLGRDAEILVWQEILDWTSAHRPSRTYP